MCVSFVGWLDCIPSCQGLLLKYRILRALWWLSHRWCLFVTGLLWCFSILLSERFLRGLLLSCATKIELSSDKTGILQPDTQSLGITILLVSPLNSTKFVQLFGSQLLKATCNWSELLPFQRVCPSILVLIVYPHFFENSFDDIDQPNLHFQRVILGDCLHLILYTDHEDAIQTCFKTHRFSLKGHHIGVQWAAQPLVLLIFSLQASYCILKLIPLTNDAIHFFLRCIHLFLKLIGTLSLIVALVFAGLQSHFQILELEFVGEEANLNALLLGLCGLGFTL